MSQLVFAGAGEPWPNLDHFWLTRIAAFPDCTSQLRRDRGPRLAPEEAAWSSFFSSEKLRHFDSDPLLSFLRSISH
jgi:hypothetical protein